jgi:hypothetical protein
MLAYQPKEQQSIRIGGRPGLIAACLLLLLLMVYNVSRSKHDTLADLQQRRIHDYANHAPNTISITDPKVTS